MPGLLVVLLAFLAFLAVLGYMVLFLFVFMNSDMVFGLLAVIFGCCRANIACFEVCLGHFEVIQDNYLPRPFGCFLLFLGETQVICTPFKKAFGQYQPILDEF